MRIANRRKHREFLLTFEYEKLVGRKYTRRNVTVDAGVLISYAITPSDTSITGKVIAKVLSNDNLMLTNIIEESCIRYTKKRRAVRTEEEMRSMLSGLGVEIVDIGPPPPVEELERSFHIRDDDDLKVLYSASRTCSEVIIAADKDFFADVEGIDAKVLWPDEYLYEEDGHRHKTRSKGKNKRFKR